jgi:kynurenine formamidase
MVGDAMFARLQAVLFLALAAALPIHAQPAQRVVDLGHPLSASDPTWSGQPVFSRKAEQGQGYVGGSFTSDEHFGTHLDAPAHFGGAWTVEQIPVDRLVRPGVCINIVPQAARAEDYQLTVDDIRAFEKTSGRIPDGAIVLIATGWDARWPDQARYINERNGVKHFPGIAPAAADFLARERKASGIGIDTPSVDYGPSSTFETHRTTMPQNVFHIENAANLTALPARGFTVVVAPVKIAGGSGAPTRVFALMGGG